MCYDTFIIKKMKMMELETHHNHLKSRSSHFDNDIKVPIVMWGKKKQNIMVCLRLVTKTIN